jgi:hypothetical protein
MRYRFWATLAMGRNPDLQGNEPRELQRVYQLRLGCDAQRGWNGRRFGKRCYGEIRMQGGKIACGGRLIGARLVQERKPCAEHELRSCCPRLSVHVYGQNHVMELRDTIISRVQHASYSDDYSGTPGFLSSTGAGQNHQLAGSKARTTERVRRLPFGKSGVTGAGRRDVARCGGLGDFALECCDAYEEIEIALSPECIRGELGGKCKCRLM